eukprot:1157933-Pelagomonas_calceolata.AAC.5
MQYGLCARNGKSQLQSAILFGVRQLAYPLFLQPHYLKRAKPLKQRDLLACLALIKRSESDCYPCLHPFNIVLLILHAGMSPGRMEFCDAGHGSQLVYSTP